MMANDDTPCSKREIVSLREHFERLLIEHEKRDEMMHQATDKALNLAHAQNEMWRKNSSDLQAQLEARERTHQEQLLLRDRQFLPRGLGVVVAVVAVISLILNVWTKIP